MADPATLLASTVFWEHIFLREQFVYSLVENIYIFLSLYYYLINIVNITFQSLKVWKWKFFLRQFMKWALRRLFFSADGYRPGNIWGFVREITANGKWSEKDPGGKTEKIPTCPWIILTQFWDGKWRVFCSCVHWQHPHTHCHTLRCLAQHASLDSKLQQRHKHWKFDFLFPSLIFWMKMSVIGRRTRIMYVEMVS